MEHDVVEVPDLAEPIVGYRTWRLGYEFFLGVDELALLAVTSWGDWSSAVTCQNGADAIWQPGQNTAWCTGQGRTCREREALGDDAKCNQTNLPRTRCSCGFYAYKEVSWLRHMNTGQSCIHTHHPIWLPNGAQHMPLCYILGEVWMWGRVVEHERGYRSQYAAVKELYLPKEDANRRVGGTNTYEAYINRLAQLYQVPVMKF